MVVGLAFDDVPQHRLAELRVGPDPTQVQSVLRWFDVITWFKTFWGWRDQQLPDGTVILTSPAGKTYVTTPGSALLFPSLCASIGVLGAPEHPRPADYPGDRTAKMHRRHRTRRQDRAHRISTERPRNYLARTARHAESMSYPGPAPPKTDNDPPPI